MNPKPPIPPHSARTSRPQNERAQATLRPNSRTAVPSHSASRPDPRAAAHSTSRMPAASAPRTPAARSSIDAMSPAAKRARERARIRRRNEAYLRISLTLLSLLLLIALITVGAIKLAGHQTPLLPPSTEESTGGTQDAIGSGALSSSPESGEPSDTPSQETDPSTQTVTTAPETEALPAFRFTIPDEVESRYLLLINRTTGEVLAERGADVITYPASITKVMTVITAMEELDNLNQTYTITKDLINRLVAAEASRAGFSAGEVVKAKDLLYAALLPSGADGSVGLAELVSGSEEEFGKLMTEKAKKLGMTNTNFTNATGLHDDNHYSTCRDMAILMNYALENPEFREMITAEYYQSSPTNIHESGIWMRSSMFRNLQLEMIHRDYFLGGKTGYTEEAGLCLASIAEHNGQEFMLITMGAGNGSNYPRWQVKDAAAVYDALFAQLG